MKTLLNILVAILIAGSIQAQHYFISIPSPGLLLEPTISNQNTMDYSPIENYTWKDLIEMSNLETIKYEFFNHGTYKSNFMCTYDVHGNLTGGFSYDYQPYGKEIRVLDTWEIEYDGNKLVLNYNSKLYGISFSATIYYNSLNIPYKYTRGDYLKENIFDKDGKLTGITIHNKREESDSIFVNESKTQIIYNETDQIVQMQTEFKIYNEATPDKIDFHNETWDFNYAIENDLTIQTITSDTYDDTIRSIYNSNDQLVERKFNRTTGKDSYASGVRYTYTSSGKLSQIIHLYADWQGYFDETDSVWITKWIMPENPHSSPSTIYYYGEEGRIDSVQENNIGLSNSTDDYYQGTVNTSISSMYRLTYHRDPLAEAINMTNNRLIAVSFNYELDPEVDVKELLSLQSDQLKSGDELSIVSAKVNEDDNTILEIELSRALKQDEELEIYSTEDIPLKYGRAVPLSIEVQASTTTGIANEQADVTIQQSEENITVTANSDITVTLTNMNGELAYSTFNPNGTVVLPTAEFTSGIYIIQVSDDSGIIKAQKIVL